MCLIFKDSELLVKAESPVELSDEKVLQKCFEQNYAKDCRTIHTNGASQTILIRVRTR